MPAASAAASSSHVLTAGHQIGDLFTVPVAFAKVGSLGAADEHGAVVTNREGVDHIVGDGDDGDALLARLQHDLEDMSRLFDAKRSGWLVQDEYTGAKVHCPRNRKRLSLAAGEAADQTIAVVDARNAQVAHGTDGDLVGALAVVYAERSPAFRGFGSREERTPDAHKRKCAAKLVDGRNAALAGLARAVEGDSLAVHLDAAGRRLVNTGQDLDKRGLARTVVAEQAQHFAAVHLERNVMQHIDRAE